MPPIPPRILRAAADAICPPPPLSPRAAERQQRILKIGLQLFAEFGVGGITFATLALALRMSKDTLRMHFTDIEELVGAILQRHLDEVGLATAEIPATDPDWARKRREVYFYAIRRNWALAPGHQILARDLANLPEDVRATLAQSHRSLMSQITYPASYEQALVLDNPDLTLEQAEAALAPHVYHPAEPQPQPQPQPVAPYVPAADGDDLNALRPKGMGHAWDENEWIKRKPER